MGMNMSNLLHRSMFLLGLFIVIQPRSGCHRSSLRTTLELVRSQQKYRLKERIPVRLTVRNTTDRSIQFNRQQIAVNDPFEVRRKDGKDVLWTDPIRQTGGRPGTIEPGNKQVLLGHFDLNEHYAFYKPGTYLIRHRGEEDYFEKSGLPPSNTIKIELTGIPDRQAKIVHALRNVRPSEEWNIQRVNPDGLVNMVSPPGWEIRPGISFRVGISSKRTAKFIQLWFTKSASTKKSSGKTAKSKHLGKSPFGHVYLRHVDVEKHWPDVEKQLRTALQVRN